MAPKSSSLVFLHYLTTVFDNISDAILLIGVEPNDNFRLLLANQGFTRGTGHSMDNIGKLISEIVLPKSYVTLSKKYKQVIATKNSMQFTTWYETPLGNQAYAVQLIPILSAVGECVQIAAISHNVTELCSLQDEVRRLKKELQTATSSQKIN
jgi:PAS domain-containing protein